MGEYIGNNHSSVEEETQIWQEHDWICFIQRCIDHVLAPLNEHPIPFYMFLQRICEPITAHLSHLAQCHGGSFVAGILNLRPLEEQRISLNAFLYFRTLDGTWHISKLQAEARCGQILDWATEPQLMPLRLGNVLEYPIDPPVQP